MTHTLHCRLCDDPVPVADITTHLRRLHPDVDGQPEQWPDGGIVWHDLTDELEKIRG